MTTCVDPSVLILNAAGLGGDTSEAIATEYRRLPRKVVPWRNSDLPIGFTPVRNRHIDAAFAGVVIELLDGGMDPRRAEAEALRHVARALPPLPFAKRHRLPRPSKSDNPEYRKLNPAPAMT